MYSTAGRMSAAASGFTVAALGASHEWVRRIVRFSIVLGFLTLLVYCGRAAWQVLQELSVVRLADWQHALELVSVRDAVLCIVGYRLGRELLRAVTRPRSPE